MQQSESRDFTLAEAMRKPQYWMLALMFLTACMSGLYVIGVAKDIGENMVGLPVVAANAVAIIAMANLGTGWCWASSPTRCPASGSLPSPS